MDPSFVIEGVWKSFPRWAPGEGSLKSVLRRRLPILRSGADARWALQDVTVQAMPGEGVALIGVNGAGKSTLLKLASGLGRPTRGRISMPSSTASVLMLGDAFAFELSGAENALTMAIVAGFSRREAEEAVDAIIDFAELVGFADAPVRTYSEGMKLRLAFGVVAQMTPEALVLDEVLAVGDLRFQAKCIARVRELRDTGTSLLFASHDLETVVDQCERALWLDQGVVRAVGPTADVVGQYREAMDVETQARTPQGDDLDGPLQLGRNRIGSQEVTIDRVAFVDPEGTPLDDLRPGAPCTLRLDLTARDGPRPVVVVVTVYRRSGELLLWDLSSDDAGRGAVRVDDELRVELTIAELDLVPGEYVLEVGAWREDWAYAFDVHELAHPFTVRGRAPEHGIIRPRHRWSLGDQG